MSIFVFPGKMSLVYCGGPLAKASDLKSLHLPNKGKWLAANFPTKASGNGDKHLSSIRTIRAGNLLPSGQLPNKG